MKPSALVQQREEKVLPHCVGIMSLVLSPAQPAPVQIVELCSHHCWHPRLGEGSCGRDLGQGRQILKAFPLPKPPYHAAMHRGHMDANFINKVKTYCLGSSMVV